MSGRTEPRPRRGAVIGIAAGGVFAGHWLTYLLVSPHSTARDALLQRTGHAYLPFGGELASVAAIVALATLVLGRLARRDEPLPGAGRLTGRFAAFQVLAFVSMEVIERISSSAGLDGLAHVLPTGVAIQLALSLVATLVLRSALQSADRAVAALGRGAVPSLSRSPGGPVRTARVLLPQAALAAPAIRGPPSSSR